MACCSEAQVAPALGRDRRGALASSLLLAAAAFGLPPFTTAPKTSAGSGGQAELFAVAAACHPTFDRFVIRARFASRATTCDTSARSSPTDPGNRSRCSAPSASTSSCVTRGDTRQQARISCRASQTPLCSNLRQVKKAGDFEGVVSFGLGLRRRTGFRVFRLSAPTRIVVDVAH